MNAEQKQNNILILSCGTRDLLVRYFRNAAFDRVIGADCSELAPALYEADRHYIIPRMKEEGYFEAILEICRREKIRGILPLQEDELLLVAEHRELFEAAGVCVIVSDLDTLQLCRDKYRLYTYLSGQGIPMMRSYISLADFERAHAAGEIEFPVFVKPVSGAGSVGAMQVKKMELLTALCHTSEEPLLIQEFCKGTEYGIDAYVDVVSGEPTAVFAKEKLRMRAGETEKSATNSNPKLLQFAQEVLSKLKLQGPVDMDIFERDGTFYLSEINPRFGGGFPHAYVCGMDTPSYILKNLSSMANESHLCDVYEERYVLKFSDVLCIEM